jgi:starch-binding outer membrane protein SusE/F
MYMKFINRFPIFAFLSIILLASCEKADELPAFKEGVNPVLALSSSTVAANASDSNNVVITANWTNPQHAQDTNLYKFVLEIDTSNAFNPLSTATKTVFGVRKFGFVAKDLNSILLNYGFEFNRAYTLFIRLKSSYRNNNDLKMSNTVQLRATPYKIPPKIALPASGKVFIVGGATQGGWNFNVPIPSQELARIDETTFGGVFQLNGSQGYLFIPENGSSSQKYVTLNTGAGGDLEGGFEFRTSGGSDFTSPSTSGLYKVTLDFQQGRYKLEPITIVNGLPTDLYIIGGATPGGWNQPVPTPSQQLTRRNSSQWDVTLNFTSGQAYLLLPVNGSWSQKYGADNPPATGPGLGGKIKGEGADIPAPAVSGSYKFTVDFYTGEYKLTQ